MKTYTVAIFILSLAFTGCQTFELPEEDRNNGGNEKINANLRLNGQEVVFLAGENNYYNFTQVQEITAEHSMLTSALRKDSCLQDCSSSFQVDFIVRNDDTQNLPDYEDFFEPGIYDIGTDSFPFSEFHQVDLTANIESHHPLDHVNWEIIDQFGEAISSMSDTTLSLVLEKPIQYIHLFASDNHGNFSIYEASYLGYSGSNEVGYQMVFDSISEDHYIVTIDPPVDPRNVSWHDHHGGHQEGSYDFYLDSAGILELEVFIFDPLHPENVRIHNHFSYRRGQKLEMVTASYDIYYELNITEVLIFDKFSPIITYQDDLGNIYRNCVNLCPGQINTLEIVSAKKYLDNVQGQKTVLLNFILNFHLECLSCPVQKLYLDNGVIQMAFPIPD